MNARLLAALLALTGCGGEDFDDEGDLHEGLETVEQPLCAGAGCRNLDPMTSGCNNDARTVASANVTQNGRAIGLVELRSSARCNAKWARFTNNQSATGPNFMSKVALKSGATTRSQFTYVGVRTSWSNMYDGVLKACGYQYPCRGACDAVPVSACTGSF